MACSVSGEETRNCCSELRLTARSISETAAVTNGSLGRDGRLISRRFGHRVGKAVTTEASTASGKPI